MVEEGLRRGADIGDEGITHRCARRLIRVVGDLDNALWCAEAGATGRPKKLKKGWKGWCKPVRTLTLPVETGKDPEPTPGFRGRHSGRRAC